MLVVVASSWGLGELNAVGVDGHRVLLLKDVLEGLPEDHAATVVYDFTTHSR